MSGNIPIVPGANTELYLLHEERVTEKPRLHDAAWKLNSGERLKYEFIVNPFGHSTVQNVKNLGRQFIHP